MISTSNFKRGVRIELDGDPFTIIDLHSQSPSARGANTLVKTKLRNLRTGQLIDRTFKSGEKVDEPDFDIRSAQYLYTDGESYHFMDDETYEQFFRTVEDLGEQAAYLTENLSIRALIFNDKVIGIELPNTVALTVTLCDPGIKGDTVSSVTKPATCETGLVVQVPLFIEEGDVIQVDTREGRYLSRNKA